MDLRSAQASIDKTKTADEEKKGQVFLRHQNESFYMKVKKMVKPATTGLNTHKHTNFWYCTQFYNINEKGLIDASAEVDIHTTRNPRPQPGSSGDAQPDDKHPVDPSAGGPEQPRCKHSREK